MTERDPQEEREPRDEQERVEMPAETVKDLEPTDSDEEVRGGAFKQGWPT